VDRVDRDYYEDRIRPLLDRADCEFLGEVGEREKQELLGQAVALLFPIDWPEPFGMVMIESMATGTPVIAFRRGSVPEVIDPGLTGVIVDSVDQAVAAVAEVERMSRRVCRAVFDERFSAARMASDYLDVYSSLMAGVGRGLSVIAGGEADAPLAAASAGGA
jgi:glycosyltransferase involved in cell wall biosynthesis